MKKLSLTALLLGSLLSAQDIFTVDELIIKALKSSPDLSISSSQYEASKSNYNEAFSAYLPDVNIVAGAGVRGMSDIFNNPDNTISSSAISGQLSLKQLIYDFGQTGGYADSTKDESESFLSNYEQLISDKKRDVKSAYYEVLKSKSIIEVNIENVKLNESQLYRSQKYFEAGIRTKIDVTDAKVELIKSKLELNNAQYALKSSYADLDNTIGDMSPNRGYKVYYKKLDISNIDLSKKQYIYDLPNSIDFAYANRYSIKKQLLLISSNKSKERVTSSEYYPQIYANADYSHLKISGELSGVTPQTQYTAMVNLNWNIYKGGSSDARDEAQKIQTKIAYSELAFTKLSIKTEVTNAYINLDSAKDSVELSKSLLEASKEKFTQASQRYEHGLSDYIELQQARQGYIDASATLVNNFYNYFDAIAILDNAIGK